MLRRPLRVRHAIVIDPDGDQIGLGSRPTTNEPTNPRSRCPRLGCDVCGALADGVHRVAEGQRVIDPELVAAALEISSRRR